MPAPDPAGSLSTRIHKFLIDYHTAEGYTPKQISSILPPPSGFDPDRWPQRVANQLAREARNGTLVKTVTDRTVRYRRASSALTEAERRGQAKDRLRELGVSVTADPEYPPETLEAAAGVFSAARSADS